MLFNSLTFGAFFLFVLASYWAIPWHRTRLAFLLLASWIFYLAWYPTYLILFLLVTAMNYLGARFVALAVPGSPKRARAIVVLTVVFDLANLGFFKYFDFFANSGASLAHLVFGIEWQPPAADLFLPLGISFYTFQMIAYVVDVHRGDCELIRNPLKMSLFIAFFPQLIAGPIVRAREFIGQLSSKRHFNSGAFLHGLDLIAFGTFKKVMIADQLAPFVDSVFSAPVGQGRLSILLAVYAYSAQIYCDFSGYTDIGRGCAYCLGFELPRNFRAPYFSVNVTQFWRRWHMTLSNWLRDYLYIPLGGNRRGRGRTYLNLILTMGLGGLWHGAGWTFVVWGLLHGVALAGTRLLHERSGVPAEEPLLRGFAYRTLSMVVTFHFVSFAWIFFRAQSFSAALAMLAGLFGLSAGAAAQPLGRLTIALVAATLLSMAVLHAFVTLATRMRLHQTTLWRVLRPALLFAVIAGTLLFSDRGAQQFIYFQF